MAAKIYITLTMREIQSSKRQRLNWWSVAASQRVQKVKMAPTQPVILTCNPQEPCISTPVVSSNTPTFVG